MILASKSLEAFREQAAKLRDNPDCIRCGGPAPKFGISRLVDNDAMSRVCETCMAKPATVSGGPPPPWLKARGLSLAKPGLLDETNLDDLGIERLISSLLWNQYVTDLYQNEPPCHHHEE